jgi:hypothetical protein
MKNAVFLDVAPGGSYLLITANVVPSSLILFNPKIWAECSSETSVLTRPTNC